MKKKNRNSVRSVGREKSSASREAAFCVLGLVVGPVHCEAVAAGSTVN